MYDPRRLAIAFAFILLAFPSVQAQQQQPESASFPRVFNVEPAALAALRDRVVRDNFTAPALDQLHTDAARALKQAPLSVTAKDITPPSGDKHDYMTMAPYWWPDPKSPNGLPYIRRDGETNPEIQKIPDHRNFDAVISSSYTLALAYYLFRDETYAAHAELLLRTWFLEPATRMNPNLQFAQGIRGINTGRGNGLIETRSLGRICDAVGLLAGSKAWTSADDKGLHDWFAAYLKWMRESENGKAEAAAKNNHGTYYDVQVTTFALFVGDAAFAKEVLSSVPERRIALQVEPDGEQPLELARTKALGYSTMNLAGLFQLARLGDVAGVDLWNVTTPDGRSIRRALDYLVPYVAGEKQWMYQQIAAYNAHEFTPLLLVASDKFGDPHYRDLALKLDPDVARNVDAFLVGLESAQSPASAQIGTAALDSEIRQFLGREISADVSDIHTVSPPPDRVLGALTTGEFSWGTFMRSLAAYSQLSGQRTVAGQDMVRLIAQMGLIESQRGGKTWAQLYGAESLESFGTNLNTNPLWLSLSPEEKEAWRGLLDPARFYDVKTHHVINLPENYLGVAARIAGLSYRLGIATDRAYVDDLLDRAADQFTHGTLFADDGLPVGRFDRYSNEYARDVYLAAEAAGRPDIEHTLEPSLNEQMRLWWNILSPDGYSYNWGRTIGDNSYMDTLEIVAFLCTHPQFSPASLPQLATTYTLAWRSLRRDYQDQTHLLSLFAFGRGQYSYMTIGRQWQQTTSFFAKLATTDGQIIGALRKAGIASFPAALDLPAVAQFTWFRRGDASVRPAGVWVVRQGPLRFALPIVTGTEAAMADYEPAPHGLPGFAVPVEQRYPCLVPFLELDGGKVIAAADGADEIRPSADGRSLTAIWTHWAIVGGKAGDRLDPSITATVVWSIRDGVLHRSETLVASQPVTIHRWWLALSSTGDHLETSFANGERVDRVTGEEASLELRVTSADWPIHISSYAPGDSALGKAARRPILLHLLLTSPGFVLKPAQPLHWEMDLRSTPPSGVPGASSPCVPASRNFIMCGSVTCRASSTQLMRMKNCFPLNHKMTE